MQSEATRFAKALHQNDIYVLKSHIPGGGQETCQTYGRLGDSGGGFIHLNAQRKWGTSLLLARVREPVNGRQISPAHDVADCLHVGVRTNIDQINDLPPATALVTVGREAFAVWRLSDPCPLGKAVEIGKALAARCGGKEVFFVPLPGTMRGGVPVTLEYRRNAIRHHPDKLATAKASGGRLALVRGDMMDDEETDWIWEGMIASGVLVMIVGPAGTGKSQIGMSIAAGVTTGRAWPDGARGITPGSVVFIETEDPKAETRNRAEVAGVDMSRILIQDSTVDFSVVENIEALERDIDQMPNPRLIVLSPGVSFFGANCRAENVRQKTKPLLDMAKRRNMAVISIGHTAAGKKGRSGEDVAGPQVFQRLARNVLSVAIDENDPVFKANPKAARRLMFCAKGNNTADDWMLPYKVIGARTAKDRPSSHIQWLDASEAPAELLRLPKPGESAAEWLRRRLTAAGDAGVPERDIRAEAEAMQFARSTLHDARTKLGVRHRQSGWGERKTSVWFLEESACDQR